ncbi:MAG: MFS transporter [Blautia sp.]|nr:MFS transporter [Blautia sp.]
MAAKTEKKGLLNGMLSGDKWNTRIRSANVRPKEMWLGYVLGPFGIMMLQSIVNSYFNQYLTDVLGFTNSKGAWIASFMVIFPFLSKFLDAVTNAVMAKMIDRTTCKQGKLRPWFLLSLPIIVVSVVLMFWIPVSSPMAQAVWIAIAYNLFYSVGYTMWYMSYELSAALSTRNYKQRSKNSMAGQITKNMGTGMISMFFPTILTMICNLTQGNNQSGYLLTMSIMCCIAVPLTFVQYFFTRERITEERRIQYQTEEEKSMAKEAPFMTQLKACFKDRYWVMLIIMMLVYQVLNALRTVSQVFYSGWVVNGNAYGEYAAIQAKFSMIALAPMGPGILLLLPLVKKFGRRICIVGGAILAALGSAAAFFSAGNSGGVYGGSAIAGLGAIAFIYTLTTFIGDAIDHVEYSQGVRVEGITAALVGFVHCFSNGIGQSIFNLGLMVTNYTTPEQIGEVTKESGKVVALFADQPAAASGWINFAYQGSFLFMGILFFILFAFFFDIEKRMPVVHDALQQKKKEECEAMGIAYIPAQEQERMEREKQKAEAEENRIRELQEHCRKTGKNFEEENQKVLEKQAKKAAKKAKKKS